MDAFEDNDLVRLAVGGDGAALATLLAETEPLLMRYAERRLSSRVRSVATPEDVVQETFLHATRTIRDLEPRGRRPFTSWVLRIAHFRIQAVVNRFNRRRADATSGTFDESDSVIWAIEELATLRRSPSDSVASRELMELVGRELGRLPEHYRVVIECRYLMGLDVDQTAARMGRERQTIPALTTRALAVLREELRTASRMT